jgi:HK97 family phage prohead protease
VTLLTDEQQRALDHLRVKYTDKEVEELGKEGKAYKNADGHYSYPIVDQDDLEKAIHAVGEGGADHDGIRHYIIGRAKALGLSHLIPDNWNADGSLKSEDVRRRVTRMAGWECRDSGAEAGAYTITGHPIVFDEPCDFRFFKEYIAPGALKKALEVKPLEVVSNWQHDDRWILGHTLADTLKLSEDDRGVEQWTRVAPTSWAADLRVLITRGDIQQASFCFTIKAETWEYLNQGEPDEEIKVTITEVGTLYDVTVCALGAYPQTDVTVASRDRLTRALQQGRVPGLALEQARERGLLTEDPALAVTRGGDSATRATPRGDPENGQARKFDLALERHRLALERARK